jgi:SAM-dependent methyltransferase
MPINADYHSFDRCIICKNNDAVEIAGSEQLDKEARYREELFRSLFKPHTPDYILKDHIYFTHTYKARLVACKRCGLVYRDPRLSEESATQEYSEDIYHPEWLEASYSAYYNAFKPLMPHLVNKLGSRRPRVLEIGSHVGGFLAAARDFGWDAQGVDLGHCVSDFARSKSLKVFSGPLSEANFPSESFDAVFVWVCFDQLPDPWKDLKEINRILIKGGYLFAKVPNGDFIKIAQQISQGLPSRHLRSYLWKFLAYSILLAFPFQIGYTPSTLRSLLGQSGFENIEIRNRKYIPVTNPNYVDSSVIDEELRYIEFVNVLSELVYYLSGGSLIKGPWIEFVCRKAN